MIHSARATVPPVAITILTWKLFCFAKFWKVGTDGRTLRAEIVITAVLVDQKIPERNGSWDTIYN